MIEGEVPPVDDLEGEIDEFRRDEESAQKFFFAYLGIFDLTATRPDVLEAVRWNSTFWVTTRYSLYASTFLYLGRIFDQRSAHNVDRLLKMVERNLPLLNRDALRRRKEQVITPEQAADYVLEKHEMTIEDVRALRAEVKRWRKIYEPVYGAIRDHLAHNKRGVSEMETFTSQATVEEIKRMLGFLHALHEGLVELWLNGRNPLPLQEITFMTPPDSTSGRQLYVGEVAYHEAQESLLLMLRQP